MVKKVMALKVKASAGKDQHAIIVQPNRSPVEIIQSALVGKGGTIDDLKEMLAFQKDWEANEARKLFNAAFTKAQSEIQAVIKTKTNKHTSSKYADLSAVIESAKPVYTRNGFAVIFYELDTTTPDIIRIGVDVLHEKGHKESYHYDMPLDGKGIEGKANMTKIHGKASSVAYGRRYLMCMIWNIPTQDDDGNAAGKESAPSAGSVEVISDKERSEIVDCLTTLGKTPKSFCALMKIESIETMPKLRYQAAMNLIKGEAARLNIKLC